MNESVKMVVAMILMICGIAFSNQPEIEIQKEPNKVFELATKHLQRIFK